VRRAIAVATAIAAVRAVPCAAAEPQRVALVRSPTPDATLAEANQRIRGELQADGFDVVEVDAAPDPGVPAPPGEPPTIATIALALAGDDRTRIAELRVVDRLTNKVVIRRSPVDAEEGPQAAEVLAVRAVELLRASLLELLVEPPHAAPPPRAEVRAASRWAARALAPERPPAWAVEAGATIVGDFSRVPAAVLALARIRRAIAGPLALRLTIAGLGTTPRVDASAGSASVTEAFGLLELVATLAPTWPVRPTLSIGGGASYVSVDGRADYPYSPEHNARWGAAGDAGAGIEIPLGRHFAVSAEGHVLVIAPYPVVQILGVDAGKIGLPSVAGSLSVAGWL
jgi:hypothetical protein